MPPPVIFDTYIPTGGMFIPFTFIVAHASAHGMSPHLAQYLVVILNATRYGAPSIQLSKT